MADTAAPTPGTPARTPAALTASAAPRIVRRGDGSRITLASGRVVVVTHGPDFATLVRGAAG
jgi:hypothetical protein